MCIGPVVSVLDSQPRGLSYNLVQGGKVFQSSAYAFYQIGL